MQAKLLVLDSAPEVARNRRIYAQAEVRQRVRGESTAVMRNDAALKAAPNAHLRKTGVPSNTRIIFL